MWSNLCLNQWNPVDLLWLGICWQFFVFFLFDWLVTNTHLERRSEKQLFLEWHLILGKEMCQGIKKVTVERKHCRVWWFGSAEMENETSPCLREKILPETELSTRVTENRIFRIIYYEYIYWEKESDIITFAYELGFCPTFSCQDKSDEAVLLSCLEQPWGLWHSLHAVIPNRVAESQSLPSLAGGKWCHRHQALSKLPGDSRMNERFNVGKYSLIKGTYLQCPFCVLHPKRSR